MRTRPDVGDVLDFRFHPSQLNVNDLLAFVAIARLGSASRAAVQLNIAQSALSRRLQRLEGHLHQQLFNRHARGMRLTEAGKILLEHGDKLNLELLNIEARMRALAPSKHDAMRIAVPHGAFRLIGSDLVKRFSALRPSTRLHLFERESIFNRQSVLDGDVGLALAYNPEPSSKLEITPLLTERLLVVGPAAKSRERPPYPRAFAVRELARLPLILPGSRHGYRRVIEQITRHDQVEPNITLEVHGLSAIAPLVEKGLGFTVSTFAHMQSAIEEGKVVAVPIDSPHSVVALAMLERMDAEPSQSRDALKQAVHEAAQALLSPQYCHVLGG